MISCRKFLPNVCVASYDKALGAEVLKLISPAKVVNVELNDSKGISASVVYYTKMKSVPNP